MIIDLEPESVGWLSQLWERKGASFRLAGDGLAVLLAAAIGSGFSFLSQVMLARILGPEQFGIYSLVLSWVAALSLLLPFGLDATILRFVAAYGTLRNFSALRGLLLRITQIVAGGSLIAAALMAAMSMSLRPGISQAFLVGALLLPMVTLFQVGNKIVLGLHHPVCSALSGQMVRHSTLAALILILGYGMRIPLTAQRAVLLAAAAMLVGLVTNQYFTFLYLPKELFQVRAEYRTREWLGVGLPLMVVTAAEQTLARGDIIILGVFRTKTEVGFYGAVVALTLCMDLISASMNSVIAPRFAELHAKHDRDSLQKLLTRSSAIVFLATLPIGLLFILFGRQILQLFGKDFSSGASALALLSIASLIRALAGSVGLLLSMTGLHSLYAKTVVVTACIAIGLDLALIPSFGVMGAAVSTLLGVIVGSVILGMIVIVNAGIVPSAVAPVLMRFPATRKRILGELDS